MHNMVKLICSSYIHNIVQMHTHRNGCSNQQATHSQSLHPASSEVDTTADDHQPVLATPTKMKTNEAYITVVTCITNPSYTVVGPRRES